MDKVVLMEKLERKRDLDLEVALCKRRVVNSVGIMECSLNA